MEMQLVRKCEKGTISEQLRFILCYIFLVAEIVDMNTNTNNGA